MKLRMSAMAAVLLAASWVMAQNPNLNTNTSDTPQASSGSSSQTDSTSMQNNSTTTASPTTLKGCLSGSPASGTYTLTDDQTGKAYVLTGSLDALRTLVGNEVQVTGQAMGTDATPMSSTNSGGSATDQTGAAAGNGRPDQNSTTPTAPSQHDTFQVSSATKVADQCGASGSSGPTSSLARPIQLAALTDSNMQTVGSTSPGTTATPPGQRNTGTGMSTSPQSPTGTQTATPGTAATPGSTAAAPGSTAAAPGSTASQAPQTATPPASPATPMPGTTTTPETVPPADNTTSPESTPTSPQGTTPPPNTPNSGTVPPQNI
jgi:hypothetical protein